VGTSLVTPLNQCFPNGVYETLREEVSGTKEEEKKEEKSKEETKAIEYIIKTKNMYGAIQYLKNY
jgi:hypothetical protein